MPLAPAPATLIGPIVLMRHGTSEFNVSGRWAGWQDVDVSPAGVLEVRRAGHRIAAAGIRVDSLHTSMLLRARRSAAIVAAELALPRTAVHVTWRLNERHGGALEGLTRSEMVDMIGRNAVRAFKHTEDHRPPQLDHSDFRHPRYDPLYGGVPDALLPDGESVLDLKARVMPYWWDVIKPELRHGSIVAIVTHEHVIRLLRRHLSGCDPIKAIAPASPSMIWLDSETGLLASETTLIDQSDPHACAPTTS